MVANGAGQAILQLDVSYGVDWTNLKKQPPVEAFELTIDEDFSKFGNKSHCVVTICARCVCVYVCLCVYVCECVCVGLFVGFLYFLFISHLTEHTSSCFPPFRWINTLESETSSATVIEIEVPTGYVAFQIDLERSIHEAQVSRSFPSLRDVIGGHGDTFAKKTVWFFDYVSNV